ncbi:MAG: DUF2273 domain-containing protein [Armatimonadota bacterium]
MANGGDADYRPIIGALIGLLMGVVFVAFGFWKAVLVICLSLLGWLVARLWPQ